MEIKHKISQENKKCLSGSMSCHILHGMIEYGLTKKKIFEQKYEEREFAKRVHASARSCCGWEETAHWGDEQETMSNR